MKKSDLKYGNVVEIRNGSKYLYIGDNVNLIFKTDFLRLDREDFDLLVSHYQNDFTYNNRNLQHLDIMKVYKDYTCKELLWERKEKPQLNEDEKAILRNVPKHYKWIARDKCGTICVFIDKPHKSGLGWGGNFFEVLVLFSHLFQFIKWEDEEPYSIEELLKGEEK